MKNYINRLQNNDSKLIKLYLWNKDIDDDQLVTIIH